MGKKLYEDKKYFVPQTSSGNMSKECSPKVNDITNVKDVIEDFSEKINNSGYSLSRATSQIVGYVKK